MPNEKQCHPNYVAVAKKVAKDLARRYRFKLGEEPPREAIICVAWATSQLPTPTSLDIYLLQHLNLKWAEDETGSRRLLYRP